VKFNKFIYTKKVVGSLNLKMEYCTYLIDYQLDKYCFLLLSFEFYILDFQFKTSHPIKM